MHLSVILMFFYCIGTAHNLLATNDKDIETGLSTVSLNDSNIIIDGAAANTHNTGNESIVSNVDAIREDDVVNSNEEALKTSLSAKEINTTYVAFIASNIIDPEETNTPQNTVKFIHPNYEDFCSRKDSFDHPSWTCDQQTPDHLAAAGFFYTGATDTVRCFCCDMGLADWEEKDNAWQEHARHVTNCQFLTQKKGAEYIAEEQKGWRKIYTPKSPKYEDVNTRLRTYEIGWCLANTPTPQSLAAAGFFYCGDRDVVRCHYCDGELRDLVAEEDPWHLHAKFFPSCLFLQLTKGHEFINDVTRNVRDERERNKQE
ncbi:MAG: hypothetical protein QS748_08800 [Candidatus Endonucleobacter bathymodioli]|uniref:Uncharacterized protein n=1 Tax=Candidatus Endonucleibacter bathymodioli TaxID=539814 RepID=A0AA90NM49_9GAMM|nr:hypothetical protein [Candidatus Endonucleobacter bathymodioli]